MKKLFLVLLISTFFSSNANAGFILENCKNIDTGKKFKNKIFIVSDSGYKKILEIDNGETTTLRMYDLETYNFDVAKGISENKKTTIIIDANEKLVEVEYSSGRIWRFSCSKLK